MSDVLRACHRVSPLSIVIGLALAVTVSACGQDKKGPGFTVEAGTAAENAAADKAAAEAAASKRGATAAASSAAEGSSKANTGDDAQAANTKGAEGPATGPDKGRIYGRDVYPCTGHDVCKEASPEDGTLGLSLGGAEHIDPNLASESAGFEVVQNTFETLVRVGPTNGPPVPGVAERWEIDDTGRIYTFHLRKNARWSDGSPVTAHDFVYSWTRKLDPATASTTAEHHFYIKNTQAFNQGKITDPKELGFSAPDDFTLVVELTQPTPFFLHYVRTGHYAPVPRKTIEAHGKDWTRAENIVVNGPYTIQTWRPRDQMVLVKNPQYWDAANVKIPRVVIHHSESLEADLRRYEMGQTHFLKAGITPDKMEIFLREKRPDLFVDPFLAVYYYAFRMDKPPFDNKGVRRAVNLAIDKERMVKDITRGMQVPATGLVPAFFRDSMGYPAPEGDEFDPEEAKRTLAAAGFPNGVGLPPVTIVYNTYESHRLIAEFVQRSLKDNLGIQVSIENMEWKSLLKKLRAGDFQVARFGWIGLPDPYPFLKILRQDSENNTPKFASDAYDKLLDDSLAEPDQGKRLAILAKAEALMQEETPLAPLYYYTRPYLKKPVLRGFLPELNDTHLFQYMSWGDKP